MVDGPNRGGATIHPIIRRRAARHLIHFVVEDLAALRIEREWSPEKKNIAVVHPVWFETYARVHYEHITRV